MDNLIKTGRVIRTVFHPRKVGEIDVVKIKPNEYLLIIKKYTKTSEDKIILYGTYYKIVEGFVNELETYSFDDLVNLINKFTPNDYFTEMFNKYFSLNPVIISDKLIIGIETNQLIELPKTIKNIKAIMFNSVQLKLKYQFNANDVEYDHYRTIFGNLIEDNNNENLIYLGKFSEKDCYIFKIE
jgi:hypothetical protein